MGRKKIENKKVKISVTLEEDVMEYLNEVDFKSKSQFVNWLLIEYFN